MIEELINRTNEDRFSSNWNLKLNSINGQIKSCDENVVEINLILENESGSRNAEKENWIIEAEQVIKVNNIFRPIYLPYIRLSIQEEHPLLWDFKYDELECEIYGKLNNPHEFTSKLSWLYEEQTGRFIDWRNDFHELRRLINGKEKIPLSVNMKTYNFIKEVIEEFNLKIEINEIRKGDDKGYLNRPNLKVLIFGNPDIVENNYNLGQPYVMAERFTAKRVKNRNGT